MMRAVLLLVVGAWFALNALPAWAQTTFIYHRDIGATITFAWTHDKACPQMLNGVPAPSTFDAFEFQGIKEGSTTDVRLQGRTVEVQVPIQAAFEGQLYYRVRAVCLRAGVPFYSDYASSKDPAVATVDGAARGWLLSYDLRAPSEVIIAKP
jgi:hypothetical protein